MDTDQMLTNETPQYNQAESEDPGDKYKSKRKYDIIVFGASGFTGKFIVREMGNFSQIYNFTWAIAGRDKKKLQKVLDDLRNTRSGFENESVDLLYADVSDPQTIMQLAQTTSVIINCVGPYYMYGEVVVKSCILSSTHYVDITAESLFMDKMTYEYNSLAETNGSVVVSALGLESVPADLGVEFLYKNFNGELQSVEAYIKFYSNSCLLISDTLMNDGTWTSVLLHLASKKERSHYRKLLDESMGITRAKPYISKLLHREQISKHSEKKEWSFAFPEPDQAVIARSIHHAKTVDHLPYNFNCRNYMIIGGLTVSILALLAFVILSAVAIFEPIKNFFIRFPRLCSFGIVSSSGPNEKSMENLQMSLTLIGHGSTSNSVNPSTANVKETMFQVNGTRKTIVKVKARNPGYGFTSKAAALGAITLLKDENIPKGGVLTPASAFRKTQFMNRLIEHNAATFEIESDMVLYDHCEK